VGGSTDLAAGLLLAGKFKELAVVVIVTDGVSNDNRAAVEAVVPLKRRGIRCQQRFAKLVVTGPSPAVKRLRQIPVIQRGEQRLAKCSVLSPQAA